MWTSRPFRRVFLEGLAPAHPGHGSQRRVLEDLPSAVLGRSCRCVVHRGRRLLRVQLCQNVTVAPLVQPAMAPEPKAAQLSGPKPDRSRVPGGFREPVDYRVSVSVDADLPGIRQ